MIGPCCARTALLIGTALFLCGCDRTVFESAPPKTLSECDKRFVGSWRIEDPGHEEATQFFVTIDRACQSRFIDPDEAQHSAEEEPPLHVAFSQVAGKSLLLAKVDVDKGDKNSWADGYTLLRYEFDGRAIRLYPVDAKRIAHRIIDGEVHGRTEYHNAVPAGYHREPEGSGIDNFVAGSGEEMARVIALDGTFDKDFFVLKRVSAADISKARSSKQTPQDQP